MPNAPKELWDLDVVRSQISAMPFFAPMRAYLARQCGLPSYEDYCDAHGVTAFASCTKRCTLCAVENPRRTRAEARALGMSRFLAECPTHGETDHDVPRGKCLTCFTTLGAPRAQKTKGRPITEGSRAAARRAGETRYLAGCATHGETAHSVQHGKCLGCFTASGSPRSHRSTEPARGEARRSGAKTYAGTCDRCGPSPHHTASGTCAFCCTVNGAPRRSGAWIHLAQRPA